MAKDIYRVIDTRTHEPVKSGFAKKQTAKKHRNKLMKDNDLVMPKNDGMSRFIVCRGEDHPAGSSNGVSKRVRGAKSNW